MKTLLVAALLLLAGSTEHRCPTDNAIGTWTGNRDGKDCQYYHIVTDGKNGNGHEQTQHLWIEPCGEKP